MGREMIFYDIVAVFIALYLVFCLCAIAQPSIVRKVLHSIRAARHPRSRECPARFGVTPPLAPRR